jgi:CTP:molybdopterin cytidylyltransferase MocA
MHVMLLLSADALLAQSVAARVLSLFNAAFIALPPLLAHSGLPADAAPLDAATAVWTSMRTHARADGKRHFVVHGFPRGPADWEAWRRLTQGQATASAVDMPGAGASDSGAMSLALRDAGVPVAMARVGAALREPVFESVSVHGGETGLGLARNTHASVYRALEAGRWWDGAAAAAEEVLEAARLRKVWAEAGLRPGVTPEEAAMEALQLVEEAEC